MSAAYSRASTLAAYTSVAAHGGVAAADPHQLIMMLLDGALARIAQARGCIEHNQIGEKARLLHSAMAIVDELRASLDLKGGGSIAANLEDLYDYSCRQLVKANLQTAWTCSTKSRICWGRSVAHGAPCPRKPVRCAREICRAGEAIVPSHT